MQSVWGPHLPQVQWGALAQHLEAPGQARRSVPAVGPDPTGGGAGRHTRVSQRFVANTRLVMVAGAIVVSCVFIFDGSDVWNRLAPDPESLARSDRQHRRAD